MDIKVVVEPGEDGYCFLRSKVAGLRERPEKKLFRISAKQLTSTLSQNQTILPVLKRQGRAMQ